MKIAQIRENCINLQKLPKFVSISQIHKKSRYLGTIPK